MIEKHQLIMVVDDDKEMLKMLDRALKLEGYDVTAALDGGSALTQMDDRRPDLVILDILMPGMDGFRVLDLVRQRSNVPVIMLTGVCEVTTLRDAIVLGADDYVRKPFRMRELTARVRAKIRRASMGARLRGA